MTITVDVRLTGGRLRGTASEGGAARPLSWSRGTADVCERRFLVAPGGADSGLVDVAVATDCAGRFLGGAFAARGACAQLGCGGAVTAFAESGRNLTVGLASGGVCPGTATLHATFDPVARAYGGSFSARDCQGPTSGSLFAERRGFPLRRDPGDFRPLPRLQHRALPGGGSVSPFYPNGEVLAHTPASLLIRWRDVGPSRLYQRAAYALAGGGLKIQLGPLAATAAGAPLPPLDPAAACDDANVICYGPQSLPGF